MLQETAHREQKRAVLRGVELEPVFDVVVVAGLGGPGDQLADKAGKEQHDAKHQGYQGQIEERLVGHCAEPEAVRLPYQFLNNHPKWVVDIDNRQNLKKTLSYNKCPRQ